MTKNVDRFAPRVLGDPDHPCSRDQPLEPVTPPDGWQRRNRQPYESVNDIPTTVPIDVGLVDVRPNVRPDKPSKGCRTIFKAWSVHSHLDGHVVARVQDVWLLGARLHISETLANQARVVRHKNVNSWFYGFYVPTGSIDPDESSAMDIRYDPWSLVHPGFYEADRETPHNTRIGRDVRDDRFDGAIQFAAVHIWINQDRIDPE